jgi:hypothetical protein
VRDLTKPRAGAPFLRRRLPWEVLITALAGAFYAAAAFSKPPWHDELFTRLLSGRSPAGILEALKTDSGPPLYYFIMRVWGGLLGDDPAVLRLFSALCILAAGWIFVRIMKRIRVPLPSPALMVLFYLFPLNLFYAAEARAYALLMLLIWIFLDILFSSRRVWALSLVFALMLYTHNLAVLYLPLLLLLPFAMRRLRLLGVPVIAGLAYWPFLSTLLSQPGESIRWMQEPFSALKIVSFLSGMGPMGPVFPMFPVSLLPRDGAPALPLVVAACAALIALAGLVHRETAVRVCALGFLVTGTVLLGISALYVNVYFPSRGEALAFPFFLVTVLSVLGMFKPFVVRPFAACVLLLLLAQAAVWLPSLPAQRPLGTVADHMKPFVKNGDRLYVLGPWKLTLDYYFERAGVRPETLIMPEDQREHPGWYQCRRITPMDARRLRDEAGTAPSFLFSDTGNPCDAELREAIPDLEVLGATGPLYFARLR